MGADLSVRRDQVRLGRARGIERARDGVDLARRGAVERSRVQLLAPCPMEAWAVTAGGASPASGSGSGGAGRIVPRCCSASPA